MEYVCDAPNDETWFRLVTEAEAVGESEEMRHAVEKHYKRERERAGESFRPLTSVYIEQDIGKEAHIQRSMPLFLTLRADDGEALATAMLPPEARNQANFRIIIVGVENSDPYVNYASAIEALGAHYSLELLREECFPYA